MSEEIEYFKRFAAAYMRWVNFNFDRIAADVVKKHTATPSTSSAAPISFNCNWAPEGCDCTDYCKRRSAAFAPAER